MPLDVRVAFADAAEIETQLTGPAWGEAVSGEFLNQALRSVSGSKVPAIDAYATIRNAIRGFEEGLEDPSANPFGAGSRGRRRERRLIELVMEDRTSATLIINMSVAFHDAEDRLDSTISL